MGYNIEETTGSTGGGTLGIDTWTFNVSFDGSNPTVVTGDFDEVPIGGGAPGESADGYSYSALSTTDYGTLTVADGTTGEFTFTIDRDQFIDDGANQTITFTVTGTDGGNSDTDTVIINLLICVSRGTLIETPQGPIPVEALRIGDAVTTRDRGSSPIRWIGSRKVAAFELTADPELRPIRIMPGAFGENRPQRELRVSPQHRILVGDWRTELYFGQGEVLVPAKALVNGDTIHIDRTIPEVEYFHVLFDQHEIMFTEGLPTESFHPGGYALREMESRVRDELLALFPELSDPRGVPSTARMALRRWEGALLQSGRTEEGALHLAS